MFGQLCPKTEEIDVRNYFFYVRFFAKNMRKLLNFKFLIESERLPTFVSKREEFSTIPILVMSSPHCYFKLR